MTLLTLPLKALGLHQQERFARFMHKLCDSGLPIAFLGLMLPLIGIIAVLNNT